MRLAAVPAENRLDLRLIAQGPGDGFIAGLAGTNARSRPRSTDAAAGRNGRAARRATLGGRGLANLTVSAATEPSRSTGRCARI